MTPPNRGLTRAGAALGCRHGSASLRWNVTENGTRLLGIHCEDCRRWVSKEKGYSGMWLALDHPDLAEIDLDKVPTVEGFLRFRQCEWCATMGLCEAHHPAPRKLFGDDAETFPLVYLCRPCHERWHQILTPGLCTPYDPTQHADTLQQWLTRAQLRQLARVLHQRSLEAA